VLLMAEVAHGGATEMGRTSCVQF